ncbi:hypothetical protein [Candidatus Poriferisocius sp.]|uniref:hypothetical protein n=1 Tax=Candidatus Poriferisocius sp. TaxID=3101276 RepID=UPI003B01D052
MPPVSAHEQTERVRVRVAPSSTGAEQGEEPINYQGPATEIHAQRQEGHTYTIRIRARAQTGQKWSGWTNPKTIKCNPLNPVLLTAGRAVGVSPHWANPNGSWVNLAPGRQWIAPQVLRYMPDDPDAPNPE